MPFISFDQPLFLLALLLLPVFWWVGRKQSLVVIDAGRRRFSLALRCVIVAALVMAVSGLHWVRSSGANCTLFVIDASYSVPRADRQLALDYINQATRKMQGQDKVGVLTVGAEARLAFEPAAKGQVVCDLTARDGSQTNLARGITSALSYFPPDAAPRIVLLSDGNETVGSLAEAARSASAENVPIDVIPIGKPPNRETLLDRMQTPPSVKRGEPFPVKVLVTSAGGGNGTLKLFRNGKYVGEQAVQLKAGKNAVTLTDRTDAPGFYTYEARLEMAGEADTITENNRAVSFVRVEGKPRLLFVRPTMEAGGVPDDFLPRALASQNIAVEVTDPRKLPTDPAALLSYDGIILSDVPADALTDTQQNVLKAAVRDLGVGLTMIGGQHAFGAGGYYDTPLEEVLPVDMDIRKMRRFPGVALALAIDYSGSMSGAGQHSSANVSKLDLAREAADRAVDALGPQDQVGVLAADTKANIVVPMQYAKNKEAIHAAIGAINGGGGTEMSAAVKGCYELLDKADARIKHAILVTDGETGPYDYGDLINEFKKKKVTFTLVVIDEGQSAAGLNPLKRIVKSTGGRFYSVRDPAEIPKIYTREVQTVSRPPIVEEPFLPRVASSGSPLVGGINWDSAPPLLGYDVVTAKPTAEVALVSHKGDAVLATWRYGLGKSVAFLSDAKSRWGAQWVGWSGFAPFWAQTLRWSLKKPESGSYQSGIELVNGKGQIRVDAVDEKTGAFVNFLDAKATVIGPDGSVQQVRLNQTGSGRYSGSFDATKTGSYVASVTQKGADGKTRTSSTGLSVPYSPEYAALQPNLSLLTRVAEMTGGRVLPNGEAVFADRRVRRLPIPLALPLCAFALFLFPLDVAARRLLLRPTQTAEMVVAAAREKAAATRAEKENRRTAVTVASVARLRTRKAALEAEEEDTFTPVSTPSPPTNSVYWNAATPPRDPSPPPAAKPAPPTGDSESDRLSRLREAKRRAARDEE